MTRTITHGDKRSLRRIIRKHIVRSDRDFGMLRTEYIERVEVDDMAADLVEWADRRALRTAPVPAPSVVSDAAGLGDRIAALSARLAAVGFPACTCHPGDDDSERRLPSPQDWRAEIERAALSSTTLTAAPSATREATEDEVTEVVTEALTDAYRAERGMSRHTGLTAHDESVIRDQAAHVVSLADARFNITPTEDR